jgi:nitrite reductase (NAD(P)H)
MKMNGPVLSKVCLLIVVPLYFPQFWLDPSKRQQFKQFVNSSDRQQQAELIEERGQKRPADWPRVSPPLKFNMDQLVTPKNKWTWITVAKREDMAVSDQGTTSVAIKYGETPLAVYHVPKRGFYATQQMQVPFIILFCSSV